jgi:hypothetical protein
MGQRKQNSGIGCGDPVTPSSPATGNLVFGEACVHGSSRQEQFAQPPIGTVHLFLYIDIDHTRSGDPGESRTDFLDIQEFDRTGKSVSTTTYTMHRHTLCSQTGNMLVDSGAGDTQACGYFFTGYETTRGKVLNESSRHSHYLRRSGALSFSVRK